MNKIKKREMASAMTIRKNTVFGICLVMVFVSCFRERRSENAGEKMQQFVVDIANYARAQDSDFIIIPQNGPELAYQGLDTESEFHAEYMGAVSGFGMEEIFYNGEAARDDYRLDMLRDIKSSKPVLVSEYVNKDAWIDDAYTSNDAEEFLCFVRRSNNYDYLYIPDSVHHENDADVLSLQDAKNYLYLISSDAFDTKSEMIQAIAATNFDLIIIDLFFGDDAFTSSEIEMLKTKSNGGRRLVISYMNIGSAEKYRYYWKKTWFRHHPLWIKGNTKAMMMNSG
ncbi:MAG: hypothetical protein IPP69_18440 [Flavobacteriales bacterium]|nr:hypothetical protein [Flavobacteriales bacterium]